MTIDPDTDFLLEAASTGDENAVNQLLVRHRTRLRRMIAIRIDRRIAARVDPSDVVQETLLIAHRRMPMYLQQPSVPFQAWLRKLALEQLIQLNRKHLGARMRSVGREAAPDLLLSDDSVTMLVDRLFTSEPGPHSRVVKAELRARVQTALSELSETDRELLILQYVEQLSNPEIMEILGVKESALKMRHLRALERLRDKIDDLSTGSSV